MKSIDIAIIGGGAAGLMAAIAAAQLRRGGVTILERMVRCGSKILISGGGRCNLANSLLSPDKYSGGSRNFIRNVLAAFGAGETIRFFESIGVAIVEEDEGRLFPKGGARQLLAAMIARAEELGVKTKTGFSADSISPREGWFEIGAEKKRFEAGRVVLACGGSACPACGTDGSGFSLARSLGHSIVKPVPALAPIELVEPKLRALAGITIESSLSLHDRNREIARSRGQILFTHGGISGPAALNLSRHVGRHAARKLNLCLNMIPDTDADAVGAEIRRRIKETPKANSITPFKQKLPDRLCGIAFHRADVDPEKRLGNLSRDEIKRIALAFTAMPLSLKGVCGFAVAHATAGGVPLDEVRYQTMESRIARGLYLAGEVLDVDGQTGGYNFQWAWSTGFLAGRAAALSLKSIS